MSIELRVPAEDEFTEFIQPVMTGFHTPEPGDDELEAERMVWEPARSLGMVDDGRWVAGAGAFTFQLTVPGGRTIPAAGVTMVGVLSTHRRRGLLRQMMARQLDDIAASGEPVAILTASESSIYGRFGYGLAASCAGLSLDSARTTLARPSTAPGRCRIIRRADAVGPFMAAYDRCRLRRPGHLTRSEAYWKRQQLDLSQWRDGASASYWVVHEDDQGQPDGLCCYRVKEDWTDRVARGVVIVQDLFGADPEVEAALVEHVLSVDLTDVVRFLDRPVDDPIRYRVADPRRVRTKDLTDWLWLRVLDVPAALEGRTYDAPGTVVLDVRDDFRPAAAGRYRLEVSADGSATCTVTTDAADLTLAVADLGAAYLGGVAFSTLAAAARVREEHPGALATADRLFTSRPAPWCATMF
jgi:predicted acetyltransferase